MVKKYIFTACFLIFFSPYLFAQEEFSLYQQFNGRYDFTFIGNTMNKGENNISTFNCTINSSSSAELNLSENDQIEKAYLYWSGSGTGINTIKLNDEFVTANELFGVSAVGLDFFMAYADVSEQLINTGNGEYTVSEFDLSNIIYEFCPNATNYAGWGIVIIYKNESLPLNQISLFHGFDHISGPGNGVTVGELSVSLDNLGVVDNTGAKIGFMAWEGDSSWALLESLMLNGEKLSNPPLNPEYNIFNSTNSITGSSELFNMDLDIFDAQNYIQIGDTSAEVKLTSGGDFVLLSTIVTKFNNNQPDATISIDDAFTECNSNQIEINYTVYNNDSTSFLPAQTPISIYIDGEFIQVVYTQNDIEVDEFESDSVIINISSEITVNEVEIILIVDDIGNGTGIIFEIDETNNESLPFNLTILKSPLFNLLSNLTSCDEGNQTAVFNFSDYEDLVKQNSSDIVSFHNAYEDASLNANAIINTSDYSVQIDFPKEIFVRIDNGNCHSITSFFLNIHNCSLTIVIDEIITECDSNQIEIHYTITNDNSHYILPANTPIDIYVNGNLVQTIYTQSDILTNSSISETTTMTLVENLNQDIEIVLIINNTEDGIIIESNTSNSHVVTLSGSPLFNTLENIFVCDDGNQTNVFDFSNYENMVKQNSSDIVSFHNSYEDAFLNSDPILNTSNYTVIDGFPKEIFVRIDNGACHNITSFFLYLDNCSLEIVIDNVIIECDSNQIEVFYTVFNTSLNYILPINTPIRIHVNENLVQTIYTQNQILPNSSENGNIIITAIEDTEETIEISLHINVTENGITIESNSIPYEFNFIYYPNYNSLEDITLCNIGSQTATYDFSEYEYLVKQNNTDVASFHSSFIDAMLNNNPIINTSSHTVQGDYPKEVFVRIDNGNCYRITSFFLHLKNCPPTVYNGVSANGDGINDVFYIEGLYDIFENFELYIYSRWGQLIWTGNNQTDMWDGRVSEKHAIINKNVPEGTYFYILKLNDNDYPEPLSGYIHLTR